jgi:formylglycine-generating enzyme required for sulfatase activity
MPEAHPGRARALAALVAVAMAGCSPPADQPTPATPSSAASETPPGPTTAATAQRDPGTTRTDDHGVEQAWVPAGTFVMGSREDSASGPDWALPGFMSEHPAHEVRLTTGYWIDVTEVTVESFQAFVADGGYDTAAWWSPDGWRWRERKTAGTLPSDCIEDGQDPDEPQVCVTWWEAEAYAAWRGGRLPTEAEWEFAARGPDSSVYPWGNEFDADLANLDGAEGPVAVGSFPGGTSWIGAQDMAGNAMEWVGDWWSATSYRDAAPDDPTGPERGYAKVEKGGWWGPPDGAGAFIARASYRHFEDPPFYFDHHIGFRIVSPG